MVAIRISTANFWHYCLPAVRFILVFVPLGIKFKASAYELLHRGKKTAAAHAVILSLIFQSRVCIRTGKHHLPFHNPIVTTSITWLPEGRTEELT
ncbi:hypothetical protein A0H81_12507 [Grifola frondosa]|uniref:Uncharacterized protein n=1 Tax=Grifola frondosa TaxID=5627 RepID=A0A1C7LSZ6_GRIFR|nr:hypothetical protein A0H81_12507 [Grifola frondosa]